MNGEIDLAINTSWDRDSKLDGIKIRQSVLASNIATDKVQGLKLQY